MKTNSQLNVALHTLGHMAASCGDPMTSEQLASCAGTNPVVVRRILGVLRKADLVASARGRSGGWTLTRQPTEITLGHIHTALSTPPSKPQPTRGCTIANRLDTRLEAALKRADRSMRQELEQTTLADLV
ncbi:Rrf2 family transcriptional regulator [Pseudahrensia aquimaris]|uniref:Rrf2 family transcriptional regulator n=1 Tax=Pseudahrensia aquimaris TaxID=744461 RepID=A0ABW3FIY8_9HYPH